MGKKRNRYLGGGVGAIGSGSWGLYSNLTTVKDLPENAGWVAKMIADPPVYAPWLLFLACVVFLAWVFWDRKSDGDDPPSQSTSGPNSPNFGGGVTNSPMAFGDGASVMTGNDNRRGFFNDAPNYGSQTFNEGARQRRAPHFQIGAVFPQSKVQVRVYGMEDEKRQFGQDLVQKLLMAGLHAFDFGHDNGTMPYQGVVIEPTQNGQSRMLAQNIAQQLQSAGIVAMIHDGSWTGSDIFVRVGVGGNIT